MRVIFEENIENSDFIEVILTTTEVDRLLPKGLVKDFPWGFHGKRNLNVFIRVEKPEGEQYAIEARQEQEGSIEQHQGDDPLWSPKEASSSRVTIKSKKVGRKSTKEKGSNQKADGTKSS